MAYDQQLDYEMLHKTAHLWLNDKFNDIPQLSPERKNELIDQFVLEKQQDLPRNFFEQDLELALKTIELGFKIEVLNEIAKNSPALAELPEADKLLNFDFIFSGEDDTLPDEAEVEKALQKAYELVNQLELKPEKRLENPEEEAKLLTASLFLYRNQQDLAPSLMAGNRPGLLALDILAEDALAETLRNANDGIDPRHPEKPRVAPIELRALSSIVTLGDGSNRYALRDNANRLDTELGDPTGSELTTKLSLARSGKMGSLLDEVAKVLDDTYQSPSPFSQLGQTPKLKPY